jgi:branched-chain amino acid aminotransferase
LAFIDGRILPLADARIHLLDRGHLLGDGVFETLRTHRGRIVQRDAHLARLRHAITLLGLPEGVGDAAGHALDALSAEAQKGLGPDLYLRVNVTTGIAEDLAGDPGSHTLTALARRLRAPAPRLLDPGVRLHVAAAPKPTATPFAHVKTMSFLPHVTARREARTKGADDALLLNEHGRVCEATTSNVIALVQGVLHVPGPEEGAVDGLTRRLILDWAREEDIPVDPRLALRLLDGADEVWLTNTLAGILPASAVGARTLAGARGGLWSRALRAYRARLDTA